MRNIYLIRHGSPLFPSGNPSCIGQSDYPLSAKGEQEIKIVKFFLTDKNIAGIYHSPLSRCRSSAEILGGTSIPLISVDAMKEIDMGNWETLSFDEIRTQYPEEYRQRGLDFGGFIPPNGESFDMCLERSKKAFLEIASQTTEDIAIVSHAGINRVLICWIRNINIENMFSIAQPYGCVNIIKDRNGIFNVTATGLIPSE